MNKICAGIVLYEPEINLLKRNIKKVLPQVEEMYLFDNGSKNSKEVYREIKKSFPTINYFQSHKNKGIAYGLNWLLKKADQQGYDWCLTLDQDSICSSNMISEYRKYINYKDVGIISPFVLNNSKISLEEYFNLKLPDYEYIKDPMDCITSGSLTNVKIFKKLGGVNSKLFIDFVDSELNCKILDANYKILRANKAFLIQQMGKAHPVKLFSWLHKKTNKEIFRKLKVATVYTDQRLYYSARNSKYIRKKYHHTGKRTSFSFMLAYYAYFTIFYPSNKNRIKMWREIIKGYKDYNKLL